MPPPLPSLDASREDSGVRLCSGTQPGPSSRHRSASATRKSQIQRGLEPGDHYTARGSSGAGTPGLWCVPLLQTQFKCRLLQEAFPATPTQRMGSQCTLTLPPGPWGNLISVCHLAQEGTPECPRPTSTPPPPLPPPPRPMQSPSVESEGQAVSSCGLILASGQGFGSQLSEKASSAGVHARDSVILNPSWSPGPSSAHASGPEVLEALGLFDRGPCPSPCP